MRILEEFWYDNIEPTEYDTSSKEHKKLRELICRNEENSELPCQTSKKSCLRNTQTVCVNIRPSRIA